VSTTVHVAKAHGPRADFLWPAPPIHSSSRPLSIHPSIEAPKPHPRTRGGSSPSGHGHAGVWHPNLFCQCGTPTCFASVATQPRSSELQVELGINLASSQSQPQALSGSLLRLPLEGTASTVSEEGTSNRVRGPSQVPSLQLERPGPRRGLPMFAYRAASHGLDDPSLVCADSGASESVSKRTSGPAGDAAADIWPGSIRTGQRPSNRRRDGIKSCYDLNTK
jgi:hypothetical protein